MSDLLSTYGGYDVKRLPTPCFLIVETKFDKNCRHMLERVNELERETNVPIKFRAHIKTHKTAKGTLKQLGVGLIETPKDSIVVSTIKEATELLNYQDKICKQYVKDICFGLPACVPEIIDQLNTLSGRVQNLRIFVDSVEHLDNLVKFGRSANDRKWSIFIKVDMGTQRAGLPTESAEFLELLKKLITPEVAEVADLYGFYAHAGHSYNVTNILDAHDLLLQEIKAVNEAAKMVRKLNPKINAIDLTLSVGATPTSNSLRIRDELEINEYIRDTLVGTLEIHCGNYCVYDLQQLSTNCINDFECSGYVLGTVLSSYKERHEMLTNAGVMALTRESSKFKGNGLCIHTDTILKDESYKIDWFIDRISQEHGILKQYHGQEDQEFPNKKTPLKPLLNLGEKIAILPQHACITMGQFPHYFVLDNDNKVSDVWIPFQKWQ
ncbi:similar to Saccharomyces cerevisiae YGL196W DSD1 D-serine dehydratase (aka D-serine ammonia- lyase) [Maudiozyma barnettii]|uniref:D-serine dehydratase n=1 Tax=Maudiozyma barnettii TaxID=61262 RepID=A0A8H2ZFJ2_9SACH|nr:D-serine ammonia-lyase DSD1 [Kazachstania barnettii]CAB4252415.1 similar to Saccharomyces cerevisiae YGL196W DSD1 D-serine dehydratase (aka D-serine ammonia- lyase) [Kazachstania barnettii]CAD1779150.1 similar to Saccharomyces cerevisiae YGL196W DSD1 D-serine dehydratase (aka D-serine ammonia- lyase) [Kazachstania barnettii]